MPRCRPCRSPRRGLGLVAGGGPVAFLRRAGAWEQGALFLVRPYAGACGGRGLPQRGSHHAIPVRAASPRAQVSYWGSAAFPKSWAFCACYGKRRRRARSALGTRGGSCLGTRACCKHGSAVPKHGAALARRCAPCQSRCWVLVARRVFRREPRAIGGHGKPLNSGGRFCNSNTHGACGPCAPCRLPSGPQSGSSQCP